MSNRIGAIVDFLHVTSAIAESAKKTRDMEARISFGSGFSWIARPFLKRKIKLEKKFLKSLAPSFESGASLAAAASLERDWHETSNGPAAVFTRLISCAGIYEDLFKDHPTGLVFSAKSVLDPCVSKAIEALRPSNNHSANSPVHAMKTILEAMEEHLQDHDFVRDTAEKIYRVFFLPTALRDPSHGLELLLACDKAINGHGMDAEDEYFVRLTNDISRLINSSRSEDDSVVRHLINQLDECHAQDKYKPVGMAVIKACAPISACAEFTDTWDENPGRKLFISLVNLARKIDERSSKEDYSAQDLLARTIEENFFLSDPFSSALSIAAELIRTTPTACNRRIDLAARMFSKTGIIFDPNVEIPPTMKLQKWHLFEEMLMANRDESGKVINTDFQAALTKKYRLIDESGKFRRPGLAVAKRFLF